jgi:hypothetical protein
MRAVWEFVRDLLGIFLLGKTYLRNQFTEKELEAMGIEID